MSHVAKKETHVLSLQNCTAQAGRSRYGVCGAIKAITANQNSIMKLYNRDSRFQKGACTSSTKSRQKSTHLFFSSHYSVVVGGIRANRNDLNCISTAKSGGKAPLSFVPLRYLREDHRPIETMSCFFLLEPHLRLPWRTIPRQPARRCCAPPCQLSLIHI